MALPVAGVVQRGPSNKQLFAPCVAWLSLICGSSPGSARSGHVMCSGGDPGAPSCLSTCFGSSGQGTEAEQGELG